MGFVILLIFGTNIFSALGFREPPEWYKKIAENKWMFGIGVFFVANMVSSQLLSSGAFEIYVGEKLVFSKLETGDMPSGIVLKSVLDPFGIHIP